MDFLIRRAAACCVVRSVGAPPQTVYVNRVIMLFRSIDRPARRVLPVWGQEPWGWRVTFAQHAGAGRPVGPGGDLSLWRAGGGVLTPAAPRWASELWPFPLASLSDGGRLTASPKSPRLPSDITAVLVCCCQTLRYHSDLFSKPQLAKTPITTRWSTTEHQEGGANRPLWPLLYNQHKSDQELHVFGCFRSVCSNSHNFI